MFKNSMQQRLNSMQQQLNSANIAILRLAKFTLKPATLQQTAVSRSLRMHSLAFFETRVLSLQIFVLKYP